MKALFLYRYGILGGVTAQIRNRARALDGQADFTMAFLEDLGDIAILAREMPSLLIASRTELADLLAAERFDAVTCVDTPEVYPWLQQSGYRGPLLHEVHTTTYNLKYLKNLDRALPLDLVLTPSRYLQARLLDEFGLRGAWPVEVLPNCLDTDLFHCCGDHLVAHKPIVLWVGKLDDHKNWRAFLEAAARIHAAAPACEFWMLGGRTAPPKTVDEFFAQLGRLGLAAALRWVHTVPYRRMPWIYSFVARSGGVTLSVSKDESFGMSVAEALACGCPAVCPAVGALPELMEGDLARGLYPGGDIETAARLVVSLLGDAAARRRLGRLGREEVAARYSLGVIAPQYLRVLSQLIRSN